MQEWTAVETTLPEISCWVRGRMMSNLCSPGGSYWGGALYFRSLGFLYKVKDNNLLRQCPSFLPPA